MKYSIYVKNYLKRKALKDFKITEEEAYKKANEEFQHMLLDSFYEVALAKLDDSDQLKILELEKEVRFLDINHEQEENLDSINPYGCLFHGVRFDPDHQLFESILKDQKISCANRAKRYWRNYLDNCNEGEYVSLIDYSDCNIEFKTFIQENVAFIISPKLNPLKCKYLPYEEWSKIKQKLPKTKHRYSYARHEYQYPDNIPLYYVIGISYPLAYFNQMYGFSKTKQDLTYIRNLLLKYDLEDLPILDPTDNFCILNNELITQRKVSLSHYSILQ